jgi:small-conductance mechanosensitive channel
MPNGAGIVQSATDVVNQGTAAVGKAVGSGAGVPESFTFEGIAEWLNHVFNEVKLVHIGDTPIYLSTIATALLFIILSIIVSKIVRRVLKERVLTRTKLDPGLEYAFLQFVHYLIIIAGTYIGLTTMSIDMGALVGIVAVLGVGIGFGLQNLASNFISGIIMLLERPLKIGDRITVEDVWGDVTQINLRTTVVTTPDNVSIIIPNSKLLENNVINWTYGDRKVRIRTPVGVAYGSDVEKVTRLLIQAATENDQVMEDPKPSVWFEEFGDSSLNFILLSWISTAELKERVNNELNRTIDRLFRENDVEIPFPQRDLHLKSAKAPIEVRSS